MAKYEWPCIVRDVKGIVLVVFNLLADKSYGNTFAQVRIKAKAFIGVMKYR